MNFWDRFDFRFEEENSTVAKNSCTRTGEKFNGAIKGAATVSRSDRDRGKNNPCILSSFDSSPKKALVTTPN